MRAKPAAPGFPIDRTLMRIKDGIIIVGAIVAVIVKLYVKPAELEQKVDYLSSQIIEMKADLKRLREQVDH